MEIPAFDPLLHLPVLEHFYTIQGEGYHQGKASYFIRTSGCDVGCVWCDVKESWPVTTDQLMRIEEIVAHASAHPSRIAVVTGGESMMHNMYPFTRAMKKEGFSLHVETSGAYPVSGNWDWITLSPKKFKPPLEHYFGIADELKVIVYNKSDFEWAEHYREQVNSSCKLYLQPEWSKEKEMVPLMVEYIKSHPEWHISLQIHKYMNIP